jgi:hypothetical protein
METTESSNSSPRESDEALAPKRSVPAPTEPETTPTGHVASTCAADTAEPPRREKRPRANKWGEEPPSTTAAAVSAAPAVASAAAVGAIASIPPTVVAAVATTADSSAPPVAAHAAVAAAAAMAARLTASLQANKPSVPPAQSSVLGAPPAFAPLLPGLLPFPAITGGVGVLGLAPAAARAAAIAAAMNQAPPLIPPPPHHSAMAAAAAAAQAAHAAFVASGGVYPHMAVPPPVDVAKLKEQKAEEQKKLLWGDKAAKGVRTDS